MPGIAYKARFWYVISTSPRPEPAHLVVQRLGAVVPGSGSLPWLLRNENGAEHPAVSDFLRHMVASAYGPSSVRSYALALLLWLRFLGAIGVDWDRAGSREVTTNVVQACNRALVLTAMVGPTRTAWGGLSAVEPDGAVTV